MFVGPLYVGARDKLWSHPELFCRPGGGGSVQWAGTGSRPALRRAPAHGRLPLPPGRGFMPRSPRRRRELGSPWGRGGGQARGPARLAPASALRWIAPVCPAPLALRRRPGAQARSAERRGALSGTITVQAARGPAPPPPPPPPPLRAPAMYAFVRFLEDNVCYALPVSCVRDFSPTSRLDFDNQKVYTVYRNPREAEAEAEDEDESPGDWGDRLLLHKAQILALAEDKTDLENSVMQKKIKIPKLSLNHVEETGEVTDYGEEDVELRHSKRQDGRKQSEGTHKSIEAVVARLEKQNGMSLSSSSSPEEIFMETSEGINNMDDAVIPRVLYEELLRSYQQQQEEMRHIQQELERTRRQLVQQAKKLKEYGALVSEMKELRDLNRRLQDVLLLRLGSGPAIELEKGKPESIEPEPEIQKTFSEEANTSTYYPAPVPVMDKYILENGKVHLGSGIWVDEEKWHQLQVTQGDSKYTKNLAVMIWGTDVLKNRSVTGVATKKKKDAVPKPPLSPHKLSIVRECLYDRIAQETVDETEIAQRLSKVNKYICEKIMDINKSCKNEERREAKYNLQ
ncbi:BEN domain-containing protein 5 isoform X1 [Dermochelys coriacea]|uniref:BEN domain-containing protein 5 isoform X1 n=1 Tax=Dermochelys coriacea TaxID=27794 RepID=UPI001CA89698|nr:BEN domain-containing protein 5 isoform X1 [Dermochelys coriacea]